MVKFDLQTLKSPCIPSRSIRTGFSFDIVKVELISIIISTPAIVDLDVRYIIDNCRIFPSLPDLYRHDLCRNKIRNNAVPKTIASVRQDNTEHRDKVEA